MSVYRQSTLASAVSLDGMGLHTGGDTRITLRPGPADSGIVFFRTDGDPIRIDARPSAVSCTQLGTVLRNKDGVEVRTIEHLMAAFSVCEIDNVFVDIAGDETPIFDGSAITFVELIEQAGRVTQQAARSVHIVDKPFEIRDGDRFIRATPFNGRRLNLSISFDEPAIGDQSLSLDLDDHTTMRSRLAPARTFCRLADVEAMRAAGYGLGGSLENAVVVDDGRVLNPTGLRDKQEFALHKALDLLGDLRLAGSAIIGQIEAHKCGHDLNTAFATMVEQNCRTTRQADAGFAKKETIEALSLIA